MDKSHTLTPEVLRMVRDKGTEYPGTGKYTTHEGKGTYLCRQCGLALFRSTDKFLSSCGWPCFDDECGDAVKRVLDRDGRRTEILCQRCDAHLGHVFFGEGATEKNVRHCVNSLSVDFVSDTRVLDAEEAIYAGGCFWGVQTLLDEADGVLLTEVGYSGGVVEEPTYQAVCEGKTGHLEAIRVLYDPVKINYEGLTKLFLEIHNPTQRDGQGPDIGEQYKSAIFYFNEQQKKTAERLLDVLKSKGLDIVTRLIEATVFWPAEEYHQRYYEKNGRQPYCHFRTKRF